MFHSDRNEQKMDKYDLGSLISLVSNRASQQSPKDLKKWVLPCLELFGQWLRYNRKNNCLSVFLMAAGLYSEDFGFTTVGHLPLCNVPLELSTDW